jgi:mannitol/fructose-specific phosphotransferase system IIA component
MPIVPRDEREAYRQWAKEHAGEQMDETGWVHEQYYNEFLRRE